MKRNVLLWTAILTGPLVWFVSFNANFALVPWACALQWTPVLFVVWAVALAITGGSALVAWREWQSVGREWPGEAAGAIPRLRVLALSGVAISAMSFLVILAQGIPQIVLGACE